MTLKGFPVRYKLMSGALDHVSICEDSGWENTSGGTRRTQHLCTQGGREGGLKPEPRVILLEIREVKRARTLGPREKPPGSYTLHKQRQNTDKPAEQRRKYQRC